MSGLTPTFDGPSLTADLSFPELTYGHYESPATPVDADSLEPETPGGATGREVASVFWRRGYRPDAWQSDGFSESVRATQQRGSLADARPLDLAR